MAYGFAQGRRFADSTASMEEWDGQLQTCTLFTAEWRRREAMAYGFAKWRVSADSTACMMV